MSSENQKMHQLLKVYKARYLTKAKDQDDAHLHQSPSEVSEHAFQEYTRIIDTIHVNPNQLNIYAEVSSFTKAQNSIPPPFLKYINSLLKKYRETKLLHTSQLLRTFISFFNHYVN